MERSLSFNEIDAAAADEVTPKPSSLEIPVKFVAPQLELPRDHLAEFSPPRPLSELDAAATTIQKVYKSYTARRNLAVSAVALEELWWKALDFASLKRSTVSFCDAEMPEPAVSKWARVGRMAARVGQGLSEDERALKLAPPYWLEANDPRHRHGKNLHLYYDIWLDIGDGREVNLEKCPRSKLENQCITYLSPKERETYEVIVKNGKLIYKKSGVPVNTTEESKWIFVLSTSRSLYVGRKKKGTFQHSSFLAGGAATAAGRLVVEEGTLKAIWPYSDHYLPTEDNFKEFISFLQDNNVDLFNVKRCSVEDDEYPSNKRSGAEVVERTKSDEGREPETTARLEQEDDASERTCSFRDYPADLQPRALEQVNLSPGITLSPVSNRIQIPSPRRSPEVRLSPRLQDMDIPTPTVSLNLPKPEK